MKAILLMAAVTCDCEMLLKSSSQPAKRSPCHVLSLVSAGVVKAGGFLWSNLNGTWFFLVQTFKTCVSKGHCDKY